MWDEAKQLQLDKLQRRANEKTLTIEEQRLLETLLLDLEQTEWETLRPPLGRLRSEQADLHVDLSRLQAQNSVLNVLAERYSDLLARARAQLTGLVRERDTLRQVYERTLQDSTHP